MEGSKNNEEYSSLNLITYYVIGRRLSRVMRVDRSSRKNVIRKFRSKSRSGAGYGLRVLSNPQTVKALFPDQFLVFLEGLLGHDLHALLVVGKAQDLPALLIIGKHLRVLLPLHDRLIEKLAVIVDEQ